MHVAIDEEKAKANSRVTAIRAAIMMTRSFEIWRRNRLDPETIQIILAVIAITSEKFIRKELDPAYRCLETYLPLEDLQSCNVASIAAATGINRETVRRRVHSLVEAGSLMRTESGDVALPPERVQDPSAIDLVRRQLEALVRFTNESLRDGVLTLRP